MVKLKGELFFPSLLIGTILLVTIINFTIHLFRQLNFDDDVKGLTTSSFWLIVLNYVMLSARKYVEVDVKSNTIHNYVKLFDLKIGQKKEFNGIEKIFVNKSNTKRFVHMPFNYSDYKPSRIAIFETYYVAFLKDNNGIKMLLLEDKNKDSALRRLINANKVFETQIFDNTSGVAELVQSSN